MRMQERFIGTVEASQKELKIWDGYLSSDPQYLVGTTLNLADLSFAMILMFLMRYGVAFKQYPHLAKYAQRMQQVALLQETWPPHWKAEGDKDWLAAV